MIAIENTTYIRNWCQFKINNRLVSEGVNVIWSIKTCLPAYDFIIISVSITLLYNLWQINRVLLQSFFEEFKFHKSKIGISIFKFNLPEEKSEILNDLKNSEKYNFDC